MFQVQPLCLMFFFPTAKDSPSQSRLISALYPGTFTTGWAEMKAVCVCKHRYCCLFSLVPPFPHEARTVPQSEPPPTPPLPPLLLLLLTPLFSCKWECCFSVVIPNDKEVCNLNTWRQTSTPPPKYLQSAPLTHVRKSGGREVGVGGRVWARTGRDGGGGGHIVR